MVTKGQNTIIPQQNKKQFCTDYWISKIIIKLRMSIINNSIGVISYYCLVSF